MKNLKKIIATVLATTLIMSTNVFAATTTPTTYGEALTAQLQAANVPAGLQTTIATIVNNYGITEAKATVIKEQVALAQTKIGTKKGAEIQADSVLVSDLQKIGTKVLTQFGLAYNADTKALTVSIYDVSTDKVITTLAKSDLADLKAIDQTKLAISLDAAVAATKNGMDTKLPTTATGTATGTVDTKTDLEKDQEAANAIINAVADRIDADTTLNATQKAAAKDIVEQIRKGIKAGKLTGAEYAAAKAAIEALPDSQTKTDLLKALEAIFVEDTSATGTAGDASLAGTTGSSAIATTPSTLAKTATNNGNIAVAGLAMIAVAGTVFFVSKKKIA